MGIRLDRMHKDTPSNTVDANAFGVLMMIMMKKSK